MLTKKQEAAIDRATSDIAQFTGLGVLLVLVQEQSDAAAAEVETHSTAINISVSGLLAIANQVLAQAARRLAENPCRCTPCDRKREYIAAMLGLYPMIAAEAEIAH